MIEIGKILKQTREGKKLSTAEIHKITKIKESYIVALENDDVKAFPAELYYKNFLKTYAKFLNLKADEFLVNYESAKQEKQKNIMKEEVQNTAVSKKIQKKLIITLIVTAIMCAVLLVFEFMFNKTNACPEQIVEEVKVSENIEPVKAEVPPQIIKQKLVIKTLGNTWISLESDNKKVFEEIVPKGENREFFADNNFALKIGNVLNVSIYFNDKKVDIVSGASKNNVNNITLSKAEEKTLE